NESTKFISPTKTPEYLAGGKPVISTSITDVVTPYGKEGLVHIADTPEEFIAAATTILSNEDKEAWSKKVDLFLKDISWNKTWHKMSQLIDEALERKAMINNNTIINNNKSKYMFDYMIVGAGLAGGVLAERLASQSGKKVLLVDKRNHIGGNTFDFYNKDGILVHKYGPHIFHTNSKEVFEYLGNF